MTAVVDGIGCLVMLVVLALIVREEVQGRGVFRWHGDAE